MNKGLFVGLLASLLIAYGIVMGLIIGRPYYIDLKKGGDVDDTCGNSADRSWLDINL